MGLPDGTILAASTHRLTPPVDPKAIMGALRRVAGGEEVQAFDTARIAGIDHLHQAALHALRSARSGKMMARSLAMELLVYASAQRQIERSIELVGVGEGSRVMTVALLTKDRATAGGVVKGLEEEFGPSEDHELSDLTPAKIEAIKEAFRIGDEEVRAVRGLHGSVCRAVTELVLERIALLPARG